MIENFKSKVNIQVRFGDTDALGHINNAKYLSYMEVARIQYFNHLFADSIDWENEGFILAKAEINFRKPVFLNDYLELYTRVSRFGTKSFDMDYLFVRTLKSGEQEIVATGLTVQVTMSFKNHQTIPVPEKYRETIQAFEGTKF